VEFSINSAFLEYKQQANVYLIAKQLIKNDNLNVTLVGYADRETGTSEFNRNLSTQRADAVKRELIKRWKVEPSRIATTIVGSDAQEFAENNWNRAVIIILHD
jgi:outer membrane protein OmpA-like peptidoglycan-associated protein